MRVPAQLDADLAPCAETGPEAAHLTEQEAGFRATTINISGNGFAIRTAVPLEPGTIYDVKLKFPLRRFPLSFKACVARCDSATTGAPECLYEVGFCITDASEVVCRQIRRFVIRRQQESLRADWLSPEYLPE